MLKPIKILSSFLLSIISFLPAHASNEPNGPDPFLGLVSDIRKVIISYALDETSGLETLKKCRLTSRSLRQAANAGEFWIRYFPKLDLRVNLDIGNSFKFVQLTPEDMVQKIYAHAISILSSKSVNTSSPTYRWSSYRLSQTYFKSPSNQQQIVPIAQSLGTCVLSSVKDIFSEQFESWVMSESLDSYEEKNPGCELLHNARLKICRLKCEYQKSRLDDYASRRYKLYKNEKQAVLDWPEYTPIERTELMNALDIWNEDIRKDIMSAEDAIATILKNPRGFSAWPQVRSQLNQNQTLLAKILENLEKYEQ